jgi:hypothetical protein
VLPNSYLSAPLIHLTGEGSTIAEEISFLCVADNADRGVA